MMVEFKPKAPVIPTPSFQKSHLYQHKGSGNMYMGVYVQGTQALVCVISGSIWSDEAAFGTAGAKAFEDVTDQYVLKAVI